jgi:hypothetical protein
MLRARTLTVALLAALLTAVMGTAALAQESGDPSGSGRVTGPGSGEVVVEAPGTPGGPGGGGGGGGEDTGCVSTFINKTVPGHPVQSGEGGYYFVAGCYAEFKALEGIRWYPEGQAPAAPDPAVLAQQARAELTLPPPRIHTSPDNPRGVVNFPTWLWVEPSSWAPLDVTTPELRGVAASMTATPRSVAWAAGDGATVTCDGPGTPFRPGVTRAESASPDCGHTYTRSSAGQPGGRYRLAATMTWSLTWQLEGGPVNTLEDLTSQGTVDLQVAEYQALNTSR